MRSAICFPEMGSHDPLFFGDGIWPRLFNLRFIDDFPVIRGDFLTWPGPINYLWSDWSHMSGKLVRLPSLKMISRNIIGSFCAQTRDQIALYWCHLKISKMRNTCHMSTKWSDCHLNESWWTLKDTFITSSNDYVRISFHIWSETRHLLRWLFCSSPKRHFFACKSS